MIAAKLKSRLEGLSTLTVLSSLIVFITVGIAVTALLSGDPNWDKWHMSYLGEGDKLSARIFNSAMIIAAGFIFVLAYTVRRDLKLIRSSDSKFHRIWPDFFCANIIAMGISLILVGLTPRNLYPAAHDFFGHDVYYCVVIMSVLSPIFLPGYKLWFYIYSFLQHIVFFTIDSMYRIGLITNL